MKFFIFSIVFAAIFSIANNAFAQISDLYMPLNFQQAYEAGTRSPDGRPGKNYWQNRADYNIEVNFDPVTRLLKGSETITYFNNSPDSLRKLVFQLLPDYFKKGKARDFDIDFIDANNGVQLVELKIAGIIFDATPANQSIRFTRTGFDLPLPSPLEPGKKISLSVKWTYILNKDSHNRTGAVDSSSFFIAYFYPRIAVYDDMDGWHEFKYTGDDEFYNDFGNFRLSIIVPKNFVVWSTGTLENPKAVLNNKYNERYELAQRVDSVVHIINAEDLANGFITLQYPLNRWIFSADNISDVAFACSDHYLWDASSVVTDKKNGRRVTVNTAYNPEAVDYYEKAALARKAVEYMSFQFPAIPFPYSKVTIVHSLDEMEYPMMVNLLSYTDKHLAQRVTVHEIYHTYFPFYLGLNESKYAWMDEGLTTYATYRAISTLDIPERATLSFYSAYKEEIGHFWDVPVFIPSDMVKRPVYYFISYTKPAVFYLVLADLMGQERFDEAFREFAARWHGKHPTPYDFFYTFMDVSGEDLEWLIKPWIFEYGYVDLAIGDILQREDQYEIFIEKKGHYPAPIRLKITYDDETEEAINKTASVWKSGNDTFKIKIESSKKIVSIELIDISLIDADLSNNYKVIK